MLVRLWNEKAGDWEFIELEVPGKPRPGPSDDYLEVEGFKVEPDKNGNFIRKDYSEEELDAVHAFAVARLTINLWESSLTKKVVWPWLNEFPSEKLKIVLYSGLMDASFRLRTQSILFGAVDFDPPPACQSIDIVAHETTHALVESFHPSIHETGDLEAFAVIEALADLTPIFLLASIPQIFKKALDVTSNDLRQSSFLSEFAEGYSKNRSDGIRSALKPNLNNPDNPCSLGSPIVTSVYNELIQTWENSKDYDDFNKSLEELATNLLYPFVSTEEISTEIYL